MRDIYENPLITRYASKEMAHIFSDDVKFRTWRRLWIALAEAEHEMGLPISKEQVDELKAHADDINYDVAEKREREVRHDVMSHVYAYGAQCPKAKGIIHLGATSCYVGDNADLIVIDMALGAIEKKLVNVIGKLASFAKEYKAMPTLGFTHYQPAQLTTVGKRTTLWMQDLTMDLEELKFVRSTLKLRGVKGTTGTQASFLTLFEGDSEKVRELEKRVADKLGYKATFAVTGQTYPRKFDIRVVNLLADICTSAYKFSNDIRLLQNLKEIEEPFESKQIGSSAMAYKRNPMRSERISSLARFVISQASSPMITASTQWFERTLDDSANKRLVIPQSFLAADAVLNIYMNVTDGLVVYPKVIEKRIMSELPFMATETILMEAVKRGGDRQELHERIREYSQKAARRVKAEGLENNLLEMIEADEEFRMSAEEIEAMMSPKNFTGRAEEQTEEFLRNVIQPILEEYKRLSEWKEAFWYNMTYEDVSPAVFLERPNRFIAVCLLEGEQVKAHVKNTGRCAELLVRGARVLLEKSANPNRKTAYSLIAVYKGDMLVNMDSQATNKIALEAFRNGKLALPPGAVDVASEKRCGDSRIDLMFVGRDKEPVGFCEVKGVTLERDGTAYFPDAPTERGIKHIKELEKAAQRGLFAEVLFVIQLKGCCRMKPNDKTHRAFGDAMREAERVMFAAYDCVVDENSIVLDRKIPIELTEE